MECGQNDKSAHANEQTPHNENIDEITSKTNTSGIFRSAQGATMESAPNTRPPGFPTIEELSALNYHIHQDASCPEYFKLEQLSMLESCLQRAAQAYEPTARGVIKTAALLAHGIAQAQAFRDGNRRTAYFATQSFLHANGHGYLSPSNKNDFMLARFLNKLVESQSAGTPMTNTSKLEKLFTRRLNRENRC